MAIDEPLDNQIKELERELETNPGLEAVRVALQTCLGDLPGSIIGAVESLFAGIAHKRFRERLTLLLREFRNRIKAAEANAIKVEFFQTEEFQTLLLSTIRQLWTTHQPEKLRLFAAGLANAGTKGYADDDRKEKFFSILATLDLVHLSLLKRLFLGDIVSRDASTDVRHVDEEFLRAEFLASLGLAYRSRDLIPPVAPIGESIGLGQIVQQLTKDRFMERIRVSDLGRDFLRFVGADQDAYREAKQKGERGIAELFRNLSLK